MLTKGSGALKMLFVLIEPSWKRSHCIHNYCNSRYFLSLQYMHIDIAMFHNIYLCACFVHQNWRCGMKFKFCWLVI